MTSIGKFFGVASLMCGLALSGAVQAAPVTFLFGGQVKSEGVSTAIRRGDSLSGSVTYDSEAVGTELFEGMFEYREAATDFSIQIGDVFAQSNRGSILVGNDVQQDYFQALLGPFVWSGAELEPSSFNLRLFDPTSTAFDSTELPTASQSFEFFTDKLFEFVLFDTSSFRGVKITGTLDTVRMVGAGIPAPAASALLIAGLALIGLRRKR